MSDLPPCRIAVAIPTAGVVRMSFAYSLCGLIAYVAGRGVKTIPERSVSICVRTMESSNWITNRERLARMITDEGNDYLLFFDDDMTFEPQILDTMLGRRMDIVVTNYLIKTEPPQDFVAVGLEGTRVPTREGDTGLVPILYSGFGASLISTQVFKKVPQPWFLPDFRADISEYTTEDNPFFRRAREAGYTVWLDQDASKMVSHVGAKTWNWREVKHG